jgi:magnesium-transporting ATPase (P-type)
MSNEPAKAEEDLRVIRGLMERATIYRAISAPTALVAGFLSILAATAIYLNDETHFTLGQAIRPREFATIWLVVLILAVIANTFFVWRGARKSGRPFISSGMKLALGAIVPCLLIPAAFTGWFFTTGYLGAQELNLVVIWIVFYGLALLSTALFAPRSLVLLGWAFLLSGLAVPAFTNTLEAITANLPNLAMGITFGLYHLVYAISAWPRGHEIASEQLAVE